ncbi:MAG: RNA polymerase factor sigma-54 [Alphaproteobacteria bacterium]|nr:RNA polymerase factor sigma-54 [Alphaproteobacteria bacterium]
MALTPRLEMRQGQSLVMTPQLQQAIKLLQLSNLELSAFVEEELQKNPLLERDEQQGPPDAREGGVDAAAAERGADGLTALDVTLKGEAMPADAPQANDTEYDNVYGGETQSGVAEPAAMPALDWSGVSSRGGSFDADDPDLEGVLVKGETLHDHLTEQMQVVLKDPADRIIAAHLIDLVDETGYLLDGVAGVAERLGAAEDDVERVLRTLQTLDPSGVCARNLAECLAIQLKEKNRFDPAMEALVSHLELLAKRDLTGLLRICGVDAEDLADMIAEIRALVPKPGLAFGGEPIQPVVPDIHVRPSADGSWHVELNTDTLPRVLVNARYYSKVCTKARSKDEKAYLTECLNNANWLVKSLDQRAKTILKVAAEIVRQQDGFLVRGIQHLRPLNLRVVAEAIAMHESTVSRVTANKYMATPRGVFELKYFFTSAIASTNGSEAHSAESVRYKIRDLIDNETPREILSDDRIVELLKQSGVDIARRTVAKYREAMRIPSSVERRRLKQSA